MHYKNDDDDGNNNNTINVNYRNHKIYKNVIFLYTSHIFCNKQIPWILRLKVTFFVLFGAVFCNCLSLKFSNFLRNSSFGSPCGV